MLELHNVKQLNQVFCFESETFTIKKRRQRLLHTQYREPQVTASNNLLKT